MSIAVTLDELREQLASFPWGYLMTVADDGRPRVRAVATIWDDGTLLCRTGDGARHNVATRSNVTMVFPPVEPAGHLLGGDGPVGGEQRLEDQAPGGRDAQPAGAQGAEGSGE